MIENVRYGWHRAGKLEVSVCECLGKINGADAHKSY